ncbi:MAG TPA: PBP1A family penicillin-binding protein [Candidatus Dormibacteraeota bacterium]|nr:PBP1A family penicillin-binding protein [Candidatus Dormibacteraeota bacterium]
MAIKIKIPKSGNGNGRRGLPRDPVLRAALVIFLVVAIGLGGFFCYFYIKYDRIIAQRFRSPVFSNSAKIYALPRTVHDGDRADAKEIAASLRRAGYSDKDGQSPLGSFHLVKDGIEITPGPESYHSPEEAHIVIQDGQVERIVSRGNDLSAYELEPQLVTALFDSEQRSKRQVVKYADIPKVMVDAVLAIEDRRFFEHSGVNFVRMFEAVWIDVTRQRHEQGGSTITMQLSRGFFLTPEKTIRRKLTEMLIAEELEQKFSKQQIFEFYGNWVNLGQRGSFAISGFAEASRAYFNKDLKDITLPEAALLAGIIQGPSRLSPYRHPERALERRNLVLDSMVETHAITREQADKAKATPLKLAPPNVEASDAPYFVDMVRETLINKFSDHDLNDESYRIYTTLDPDLQKAAAQAVEMGIKLVDDQVTKMRTKRVKVGKKFETQVAPGPQAQVAMVVLDPHTGAVLALVGGRDYGFSQLNHALSKRPTGSIFKPFVYAAAMNTALDGSSTVITPASMVTDAPSSFAYGDQIYEPRNYKEEYKGEVTLRYALAMSLNNATVKVAEEVGYDKVADLAKSAGIVSVKATPAMALGSYEAAPLDMAGAYTSFANNGVRLSPILVNSVRTEKGDVVANFKTDQRPVLDPRISYVMTNMMEGVINNGLGYTAVRLRGFSLPAAGKTGSSHDGWFAGYTTNLLCIVWVGYDDYSELHLTGAQTAAPIWTEFMKKASALPQYSGMKEFAQPTGVVDVQLDKVTNRLATPACPDDYTAAFVAGTEPRETCDQQNGVAGMFSRFFGGGPKVLPPPNAANAQDPQNADAQKKKGFFGKIAGIFKDDKASTPPPTQPPPPAKPPDTTQTAPH